VLDCVWDLQVTNSLVSLDQELFFQWLKQLLADQNKITPELMLHFFRNKLCQAKVDFRNFKKSGFECIQQMFLLINEMEDKLIINNP